MSRGLGKLQREIIETLEEAKQHFSDVFYRGGGSLATYRCSHGLGWVIMGKSHFRIADDIYDLRASSLHLAERHDAFRFGIEPKFQAAFSRAARTLVARGRLLPVWRVPNPR
jgi:hypothetical protein